MSGLAIGGFAGEGLLEGIKSSVCGPFFNNEACLVFLLSDGFAFLFFAGIQGSLFFNQKERLAQTVDFIF
jgi:hypothetical protein